MAERQWVPEVELSPSRALNRHQRRSHPVAKSA